MVIRLDSCTQILIVLWFMLVLKICMRIWERTCNCTRRATFPKMINYHSDSHTPYEVFLNKFLWPMCWSFGIWLEWGSGLRTFKFTAHLENLVLSWVRRVVGDDCVRSSCVWFFRQHMQSLKFSLSLPRWKKKCFQLLHFAIVSYFLQVNVPNGAHVSRTLDSL